MRGFDGVINIWESRENYAVRTGSERLLPVAHRAGLVDGRDVRGGKL